jgi:hypothetical protein
MLVVVEKNLVAIPDQPAPHLNSEIIIFARMTDEDSGHSTSVPDHRHDLQGIITLQAPDHRILLRHWSPARLEKTLLAILSRQQGRPAMTTSPEHQPQPSREDNLIPFPT